MWENKAYTVASDRLAVCLAVIVGAVACRWCWSDTLASFADDSVSYLLMARSWSPWSAGSELVGQAAALEKYPPLFPLLLALTGTSQSMAGAHLTVALLLGAVAWAAYRYALLSLGRPVMALLVMALFVASPQTWIHSLGILSENLYLLLSLLALAAMTARPPDKATTRQNVGLGLLLAAVVLTRIIGVSLVAAWLVAGALHAVKTRRFPRPAAWLPLAVPAVLVLVWFALRPHQGATSAFDASYGSDMLRIFSRMLTEGPGTATMHQLAAFRDAWFAAFVLFWSAPLEPGVVLAALFGIATLTGLAVRLMDNRVDGWYVLFYSLVLILWPYPGQSSRFLHAVFPVLLLQGGFGLSLFASKLPLDGRLPTLLAPGLLGVLLTFTLPGLAFLSGRADAAPPDPVMHLSRVTQFYNRPHLPDALRLAHLHEGLRLDLEQIRQTTPEQAIIMWYTPNYLALLAERRGVPFPPALTAEAIGEAIQETDADYVFLSSLNPRDTREEFDGLAIRPHFEHCCTPVWERRNPDDGRTISVLLKVGPGPGL